MITTHDNLARLRELNQMIDEKSQLRENASAGKLASPKDTPSRNGKLEGEDDK